MKEGWEYKTLGECCDILDKLRKPIKQSNRKSGSIPYYGATGLLDFVKDYLFDETLVLLGEDGAKWGAGDDSAFIISGKSWVNNHAHVLKPHSNLVDRYLVYYLKMSNLSGYITGVTVPKLNQERMRQIPIPVTTLDEQLRIVSYLDTTFANIDKLKENASKALSEAKALFQAALAEAMMPKEGWEEKTLKEVSNYSIGLTYKPIDVSEKGTIVLRSTNIQDDKLIFDDIVRVNKTIKESLFVKNGDILMCSRNGSPRLVGKVAKIEKVTEPMTFGTFMMIIRSKYNDFLYYFFKSDCFRNQIKHGEANMINQITRYMLDDVRLNLPPISEQHQIVRHLDTLSSKVRQMEENYRKTLAECDALKQAILRDVFE